ncbi:hypothetical protein NC653_008399 [Populus alba x Populus x berolinensis]|uniref:Uncharacterized protein n=1 Tax=Populus alba x Populus x berolinensis TaxID=444605 RepID=A0AAD6R6C4_9ROSI|nr:hypothetical protein NC653_008399 [Populus alba x Populus x berolinensis]
MVSDGECAVTNREGVANFLLVGKAAENFFGAMTHHYVDDRGFKDPSTITPSMATKLNKTWIFQLRFGSFRACNN